MTNVALRCYAKPQETKKTNKIEESFSKSLVLVIDTETTIDEYQNLTFGSCGRWVNGKLRDFYVFYNEDVTEKDRDTLKSYADKHGYKLLSREEFLERVFFPYAYNARAMIVGFNLPFDLSRPTIHFGKSRRPENGISLKLSAKPWYPGIVVKSLDSKRAFISFTTPLRKNSEKKEKVYRGCFLDLRTLLFALTNQSYNLKKALQDFQCVRQKIDVEEHGQISKEYVGYNVNDTLATYELYEKAIERYSLFCLNKDPHRLYSPASIGKAILDKIGVKPFDEKNPSFPIEVKGYLMSAYYGGRVEVRIRKTPMKVTYLDFTSMYPSLYILLGLDKMLKAETVRCVNTTIESQDFLDRVTLEDLKNKDNWKKFNCICRFKPNYDDLPVRALYGNNHVYNIGVNHLKSNVNMWYALPDLIASKLLTGKTPIIEEAISFVPEGVQSGLKAIEVLKGIPLKPDEDIFKKIIEERIRIKKAMKTASEEENKQLDLKQMILKIIANSASYGIYVEINTKDEKQANLDLYGLKHINTNADKTETEGVAFNPIMATMITSGARLILAMAESLVLKKGGNFAYCDTDSIFISPEHEQLVKDFFKPLNPYDIDLDMFKVEEDEQRQPLRDVWFYGISSKRYCLYNLDKEPQIRKYSSHGLGENLMGLDQEQFWMDILAIHYHPEIKEQIISKYKNRYAVYNFRVSSYTVYERFRIFNGKKPISQQVKPFNFITIGRGYQKNPVTNEPIIPMLPFIGETDKRFNEIPYRQFIDYKTGDKYPNGDSMDTKFYWKPLSELLEEYIDHHESKSNGDIGHLERKHLVIDEASIHYIGKESNELEESEILGVDTDSYTEYKDIDSQVLKLLKLTPNEVKTMGISKTQYYEILKKYLEGKPTKLSKKTIRKMI